MNLEPFCADPDTRPSLATPFSWKGYDYATDGRIMIRVPSTGEHSERGDTPNAHVEKYISRECGEFIELPPFDPWTAEDMTPCETCGGFGGGETADDECPDCKGWGHGTGRKDIVKIEFLGGHISDYYLSKIANLPQVRIAKCIPWAKEDGAVYMFTFDGGDGVIMGMRKGD